MRLLGIDVETTGLDTAEDRITEIGAVLWDSEEKKPLIISNDLVWDENYPPLSEEIIGHTGLTDDILKEFGVAPVSAFMKLEELVNLFEPDYIVAHNGHNFDRPIIEANMLKYQDVSFSTFLDLPWIDTRYDIPLDKEPVSRKLNHMALDQDFMNPFKHRAVFDALTCLILLSKFNLDEVLAYSKIPWITVEARVTFDSKDLAKAKRFYWQNIGTKVYPKKVG